MYVTEKARNQVQQNMYFILVLLWFTAALAPISVNGSISHNLKPVTPPFPAPAPSPLPPHPSPNSPVLPPCPSPAQPPLPPNPLPLPPHPSPNPPVLPPCPSPVLPPLPPHPSPTKPPSHPPLPFPPPQAPPPSPPNVPCFPAMLTCKNTITSNPSNVCCDSLKTVYEKDEDCICTVLESPDLSKELGLNATDISNLLVECKIVDVPVNLCNYVPAPPNKAIVMSKKVWMTFFFCIIAYFGFFM